MIVLIFVMAGLLIILLVIAFSVSQGSVLTTAPFPVGNLGEDVILDCNFQTKTGQISSGVSITWQKDGLTGVVDQYQNKVDNLQQNPQFKNRVGLFPDAILKGNASLLLRMVNTDDAGVYRCSVAAPGVMGTVSIHLRVGAFSAPNISMSNNDRLIAVAQRWLPQPDVTWTDENGMLLNSSNYFNKTDMGIVQVISSLLDQVTKGKYTCVIQNDLVTSVTEATVT
ncbi:V-set domain-containing T-cell activation inhibitor 1, partial [Clarias magur]